MIKNIKSFLKMYLFKLDSWVGISKLKKKNKQFIEFINIKWVINIF